MPSRARARLSGEANQASGARPSKCIIIIVLWEKDSYFPAAMVEARRTKSKAKKNS
jgi:hypothetical protein